jgi:hypothetical protein
VFKMAAVVQSRGLHDVMAKDESLLFIVHAVTCVLLYGGVTGVTACCRNCRSAIA